MVPTLGVQAHPFRYLDWAGDLVLKRSQKDRQTVPRPLQVVRAPLQDEEEEASGLSWIKFLPQPYKGLSKHVFKHFCFINTGAILRSRLGASSDHGERHHPWLHHVGRLASHDRKLGWC